MALVSNQESDREMASGLLQDFAKLLTGHDVDCILIGGWAASIHGSMRATVDIDFVYSRKADNVQRLSACLAQHEPYLRGAPPGLPFQFDELTIRSGLNFTLITNIGDVDLLGEVTGGGSYEELLPYTQLVDVGDQTIRCVTLECLIQLKRAAGRPKDFEALSELVALLEERDRREE